MVDDAPGEADRTDAIIRVSFARFDIGALATATGVVTGSLLWLATVVLLVKGAPPGTPVGPHLSELARFLPGYTVSWTGGAIGLCYGFVLGSAMGAALAFGWNLSHFMILMRARGRYGQGGDL